jgi:hypothetical protein
MANMGKLGSTSCEIDSPEFESIRLRISRMASTELLRFGVVTKFRCSHILSPNHRQQELLTAELIEARAEWNRRYPRLPLCDSF